MPQTPDLNPTDPHYPFETGVDIGDVLGGRYAIRRLIGRGGVGVVYEAENTLINRKVAIKVLLSERARSEEAVKRFRKEAKAAGRIDSDHILDVIDIGELPTGQPYMVMEFLHGEDFRSRLRRSKTLSVGQLVPFARQALLGLRAAHQAGIIHRDLKPGNLFLVQRKAGQIDFVKLIDFGVSKFADPVSNTSVTKAGAIMGTPVYMSPEQVKGEHEIDLRSDIYAMGVILYEAVMGHLPFEGKGYNELLFQIVLKDPKPLRADLDTNFTRIVKKAMARNPDDRFQSCEAFIAALDEFSGNAQSPSEPPVSGRVGEFGATGRMPAVGVAELGAPGTVPMAVPNLEDLPTDHPAYQARRELLQAQPVEAQTTPPEEPPSIPFPLTRQRSDRPVLGATLKSDGLESLPTHDERHSGKIRVSYQAPKTLKNAAVPLNAPAPSVVTSDARDEKKRELHPPIGDTILTERRRAELDPPVVPVRSHSGRWIALLAAALAAAVGVILFNSLSSRDRLSPAPDRTAKDVPDGVEESARTLQPKKTTTPVAPVPPPAFEAAGSASTPEVTPAPVPLPPPRADVSQAPRRPGARPSRKTPSPSAVEQRSAEELPSTAKPPQSEKPTASDVVEVSKKKRPNFGY